MKDQTSDAGLTRRRFLGAAAAAPVAAALGAHHLHAAGSDRIRVGVIGTGGRGTGAAMDCVHAAAGVEIAALGDLFPHRVQDALRRLRAQTRPERRQREDGTEEEVPARWSPDRVTATPETCFTGFDAYAKVLAAGVDLIILATPPHFRPLHLEAAVAAGKHVFMEKPVAVDPAGIRRVLAAAAEAQTKGLAIVAGTQRRHQAHYVDLLSRIRDGALGELTGGQCYWNQGGLWVVKREPAWSDTEWQIRNWLYFTWLSGDHIVEQHVHNLDVLNWAFGTHPVQCVGFGGRAARTEPEYGNIFDHFAVEYEYPGGVRVLSMCRQIEGASHRVAERIVGTKGVADLSHGGGVLKAGEEYRPGPSPNPYVEEHRHLIESIRAGKPLNEGRQVAESTLTAILGRMSAYTGQAIKWEWVLKASKLDLTPARYEFGPHPVHPAAIPGQTRLE